MLDDWEKVKREVEQMQRDHDRAAGALEQSLARMKEEFGVRTQEEFERWIAKQGEVERKLARKWTVALKKFRQATQGRIDKPTE